MKSSLPVRNNLASAYAASLGIAALTAAASLAGLVNPSAVYSTEEFRQAFIPNDVVNLVVGLPILLGSMGLARRGELPGLLLWPGALLYIFYNYLVYFLCMPLNAVYLLYLTLVMASGYAIVGLISAVDAEAVRSRLAGAVPEKLCGGVLAGLGILFFLRIIAALTSAILGKTAIPETELALNAADFMVSPAWIIGGVLLWRRKSLGYAGGLGLLFSLSMLFVGLIFLFLLEPILTAAPFRWADALIVFVMGMIVFVPFALFLRGVIAGRGTPSA